MRCGTSLLRAAVHGKTARKVRAVREAAGGQQDGSTACVREGHTDCFPRRLVPL